MTNFITKRNDDSNNWIWNEITHESYWKGLHIEEEGIYHFSYLKIAGYQIKGWHNRHRMILWIFSFGKYMKDVNNMYVKNLMGN